MIVTRSRTVAAPDEAVWAVVSDPVLLPRWWPRVERVESVSESGWTTVLRSGRGRTVRADWRLDGEDAPRRRAWAQQVDGTPFARVLAERRIEARIEPAGDATRVILELRQHGRRWARFGGVLLRGAARRELDEALRGLQTATRASESSGAATGGSSGAATDGSSGAATDGSSGAATGGSGGGSRASSSRPAGAPPGAAPS